MERHQGFILYHGPIRTGSGKFYHAYVIEDTKEALTGANLRYFTKQLKRIHPGWIYTIDIDPSETGGIIVWEGTAQVVEADPNYHTISARADAARIQMQMAKRAAREDWREILDPIQKAYSQAIGNERNIIVAQVVAYITRGH